ncbi:hypothetical protein BSL78_14919 [Apostichopus japonicus]|uniref:Short-chain collagen C4 n=1 Tax=Stichopus japonicus TaxID=307972 RepID=A0A2G8KJM6_STIJA|nr:hypothetical protein BSL78_14919 [Apostichopus japonicus]
MLFGTVIIAFQISFASTDNEGRVRQNPPKESSQKDERSIQPVALGTEEIPLDVNKHGNLAGYGNLRKRRYDNTEEQKVSAADDQSNLRSPPGESASGAVYVRWGHHSCPSSSQLVYTGSAAGTSYADSGGGVNQLCLSQNPVYDSPVAGVGGERSFVNGIEYQISDFPYLQSKNTHDVPCAVCLAPARVAKLIIPGTNVCPSNGWTREYGGYLMSERGNTVHKRSMHICVDREMQLIPRSDGAPSDGLRQLLNLVEGRCSPSGGGIPCGPYVHGYELTCAVCTK